jgi:hypothetical protein
VVFHQVMFRCCWFTWDVKIVLSNQIYSRSLICNL